MDSGVLSSLKAFPWLLFSTWRFFFFFLLLSTVLPLPFLMSWLSVWFLLWKTALLPRVITVNDYQLSFQIWIWNKCLKIFCFPVVTLTVDLQAISSVIPLFIDHHYLRAFSMVNKVCFGQCIRSKYLVYINFPWRYIYAASVEKMSLQHCYKSVWLLSDKTELQVWSFLTIQHKARRFKHNQMGPLLCDIYRWSLDGNIT